ncbi:hypothetical protein BC629DRAFT_1437618 [Irpex lacteus]|nr:hypothetical protein BC629DRAFT_1437618 [Irpex lacteus]
MSPITDNLYVSSAMAGPGTVEYTEPSTSSASATLIYLTKYPGLGLGLPQGAIKAQRRLRATAPVFAPSIRSKATVYEADEISEISSSSDSGDETETSSVSSVITSASESLPAEDTPRLHRLIYRHRLRPCSPSVEARRGVSADEEANEDGTPGAPRIPFPPSPSVGSVESKGATGAGVGLGISGLNGSGGADHSHIDVGSRSIFDPFRSPLDELEQPYFYLPTQLLSSELEMSSAEFITTVLGWTQRRTEACL